MNEDATIQPGDMIYVPEKFITNFRKYVPYSFNVGGYVQGFPRTAAWLIWPRFERVIASRENRIVERNMLLRYDLREQPFGVTPDPRYLYASSTHREALASILYGIDSGLGFIALTAKPGMGKTTLLFEVLQRIEAKAKTVFLFQTISDPEDLSRAILMDLGVTDIAATHIERQAQLNEALVAHSATGKRLVLAIDEAQRLDEPVLEAVRVLSNFETSRQKLIQIVLSVRPELAEKLALPQLLQLRKDQSRFSDGWILYPKRRPQSISTTGSRLLDATPLSLSSQNLHWP